MSATPQFTGCFTLLYADPEAKDQIQYLQPLYGLTADDDPPAAPSSQWPHRREASEEDSATSSRSSSLTSRDGALAGVASARLSPPSQHQQQRSQRQRNHPRATSRLLQRPSHGDGAMEDEEDCHREQLASLTNAEAASAAVAAAPPPQTATLARPSRRVDHKSLSLYPELSTGIVGPQPVFGGAAIATAATVRGGGGDAAAAAAAARATVSQPHLFASNGAPMLSSIVDADALQRLQEARRPYPAPQSRSGHVLLSCPERGSLILFGGLGDTPFNDVWEYDVQAGRWAELPCTPADDDDDGEDAAVVKAVVRRRQRQQRRQRQSQLQHGPSGTQPSRAGSPQDDAAASETSSATVSDVSSEDDEEEAEVYDEEGRSLAESDAVDSGTAAERQRRRRQARNMPPPAYGQAASLYTDANGETCMAILGGISLGDVCRSRFFSLNLQRRTWRRVRTTTPFRNMWGATAQTLYAPRLSSGDDGASPAAAPAASEEQVVVLFGGMTEEGEVVQPVSHLFHLDHRLTAAEVEANPSVYLRSIDYHSMESARIARRVNAEDSSADAAAGTTASPETERLAARCDRWKAAHPVTLARWRRRALARMVGRYWAERLVAPEDLHGRRRPTSAAYKRHFMYVFGGRDDFYFYNDLWCLNVVTRTWVQVREGVPSHRLRSFLNEPHNPMHGALLNERGVQLRQETVAKTEAKALNAPTQSVVNPMFRARDIHHALFSSSVNSSARARTGACMVADVQRDCLYVYGGFSYTGQQHLTFFDLHAFYINENVWRRVCLSRERPWVPAIDAVAGIDAIATVNALEEGRSYARHAAPSVASDAALPTLPPPTLPPTLMGYAARYFNGNGGDGAAPRRADLVLEPPLARRGARLSRLSSSGGSPGGRTDDLFHLPSFVPEARTMATMAEDPLHPGARFFLHGGRSGEEACGDLFELRTRVGRTVDMEYMKQQRIAHEEEEAAAAVAAAFTRHTGPGATPVPSPPAFMIPAEAAAAHTAAPTTTTADTAAGHLQWQSRRQLHRQLLSAALEEQEDVEDAPAAHLCTGHHAAPTSRRTLREAATQWVRDGLAAIDAKSLMFVELRNGNAVVNLRTHIHYRSRLSLLGSGSGEGGGLTPPPPVVASAGAAAGSVSARRATWVSAPVALATPMQFESLGGHLKRSARSLELLLYDVLLSKPTTTTTTNGAAGGGATAHHRRTSSATHAPGQEPMTSPCTNGATRATSPELHGAFPSQPISVVGGSPGTSPGSGTPLSASPQMQIVSRAQYATPRTPQNASFPSQLTDVAMAGPTTRLPGISSPASTSRSSSFYGGMSGAAAAAAPTAPSGSGATPASNEYAYHVLLRSLFHQEPFCKANYALEKKR
ncbi:Kelch motif/Galactose oxidase, central domain containing protein [Novymonas esmeraldas]|uniref:Kelch motif/Galactose oxidase, central domain containing protein n=1 Tax=Novymonas esmeraldas TaxID=1808958 RepID=A0AAW0ER44_9TRYP